MIRVHVPSQVARRIRWIVGSLLVAGSMALLPMAAFAATIPVDGATCTLPDAIEAANTDAAAGGCTAGSGADTLLLTAATYSLATGPYNHDGLTATPSVTSKIVISGGVDGAIVERSGATQYRLFHVAGTGKLTLEKVTVQNGRIPSDYGGAIYNRGTLTLLDSLVFSNTAAGGGGISSRGTVTLTNSNLISNTAENGGGGLLNFVNGTANLTESNFISNTAGDYGGGFANAGTAIVTNSEIRANTAASFGGGLQNAGTITLTNSEIRANTAVQGGGFNNYDDATATLIDSIVISNTAQNGDGGGFLNYGTATLTDTQIVSNTAQANGGGFYHGGGFLNYGPVTLTNTQIVSNAAQGDGGGFYHGGDAPVTLTNTQIISNAAQNGGGFYNQFGSSAILTNTQIVSNTAQGDGGGFYSRGTATITQARMLGNKASGAGGALYQESISATTLEQSCIVDNSDTAVVNDSGVTIDAANNWWGALDGPSGAGPGAGDSVSSNVTFAPILTLAPAGCSILEAAFGKRTSGSGDLLPGQPLTFTLTLTNTGPQKSKGLYITDALPTGFDLLATNTTGPAVNINGSSYVITELLPSQVATIHLVGKVDDTLNADMVLSNTATFTNSLIGEIPSSVSNNVVVPVLTWSEEGYAADEESGTFTATLNLSPPNPYATVTVEIVITDSTAAFAVHGVQEVTFPPGSSSQPVAVPVTSDGVIAPHSILLGLQSSLGASFGDGSGANAIITLTEGDIAPAVAVTVRASSAQAEVGETITYTYRITNTGNVTLTTVSAEDDVLGAVGGLAGQLLPNATRTATLTYVVQASDLPGPLTNTVTVTGTDSFGTDVTDSDSATVLLTPKEDVAPAVAVSMRASSAQAQVGETITYTYRITNTGNVTLTTISATDNELGAVAALAGQLLPNATRSATLTYVVQASDLPGPLTNTVTVTGTDPFGTDVTDSASASVTLLPDEEPSPQIFLPRVEQ